MHTVTEAGIGPQTNVYERLPAELRALPQWCVAVGSATDKAPRSADGQPAKTNDPNTWMDFDTACRVAAERGWLIGFVFTANDPFAFIDLNWCDAETQLAKSNGDASKVDPAKWSTDADGEAYRRIVESFDSYTELSRSGKGVHIIVRANIGQGCKVGNVEVYSQRRFMVCTGNLWIDRPVADRDELTNALVTELRLRQNIPSVNLDPVPDEPEKEIDDDVVARATKAANAEKFQSLWDGQWKGKPNYPSQSEADLALLGILAFYSPNNGQVMRLFRRSELGKREKATKDDRYLSRSIDTIRRRQAFEKQQAEQSRAAFKMIGEEGFSAAALPPSMDLNDMHRGLVYIAAEKTMIVFRDNTAIQLPPPAMDAALAGDMQALGMSLARLAPPLKSTGERVEFDLDTELPLSGQANQILMAVSEGKLDVDTGRTLIACINSVAGIKAVEELEDRIILLEAKAI